MKAAIKSFSLMTLIASMLVGYADFRASDDNRYLFSPRQNVKLRIGDEWVPASLHKSRWCKDKRIAEVHDSVWMSRKDYCNRIADTSPKKWNVTDVVGWIVLWFSVLVVGILVFPIAVLLSGVMLITRYGMFENSFTMVTVGFAWQIASLFWFSHLYHLVMNHSEIIEDSVQTPDQEQATATPRPTAPDNRFIDRLDKGVDAVLAHKWLSGWRFTLLASIAVFAYYLFR